MAFLLRQKFKKEKPRRAEPSLKPDPTPLKHKKNQHQQHKKAQGSLGRDFKKKTDHHWLKH